VINPQVDISQKQMKLYYQKLFSTVWLKVKNKHFQLETKTENYFTKISWNEHLCRFQLTKIIQIDNPKLH
jgi:hypothetical protein